MISYSVNLSVAPEDSGVIAPNKINRLEEGGQVQLEVKWSSYFLCSAQIKLPPWGVVVWQNSSPGAFKEKTTFGMHTTHIIYKL